MGVLDELEGRLSEAEGRVGDLVSRLEKLGSLEEKLREAGHGLGEASGHLARLAAATGAGATSLQSAIAAFREAVDVLRRSDPARIVDGITGVERRIDALAGEITKLNASTDALQENLRGALQTAANGLSTVIHDARQAASAAANNSERAVKGAIDEAVERLSGEQARTARGVRFIGLVTLVISLGVLGLAIALLMMAR